MASLLPTQAGQSAGGTHLDPESDVQLASKTSHLTLSGSGSEEEEPRAEGDDLGSCTIELPDKTNSAANIEVGVEWQENGRLSLSTLPCPQAVDAPWSMQLHTDEAHRTSSDADGLVPGRRRQKIQFCELPTEILLHILSFLDVCDLLSTSRTSHQLRVLSLAPHLHLLRLRHARSILPPLLSSPSRPSLPELISRHIFLTHTSFISRRLSRNLVSIRLSRHLAARPSPQVLVERCVLPAECVPGKSGTVAPGIVARKRAVERERVKDGLRRFVGSVWTMGVREREEGVRKWEERVGVGRVWRLKRFWERMGSESQTHGER
ncbi:hypothetical protein QBC38DRAFT_148347 [Podospora fimiseda]|uniref:F-box domain-containing protein n=1 Tax=Podospora fimiseda TaxID=252190 RepID=A0AAN7H432_9PEZI|nr:hypothetical protein QBC38DRAFT_148347 [Podospora fimiseda]